jgi:hypothetical protein
MAPRFLTILTGRNLPGQVQGSRSGAEQTKFPRYYHPVAVASAAHRGIGEENPLVEPPSRAGFRVNPQQPSYIFLFLNRNILLGLSSQLGRIKRCELRPTLTHIMRMPILGVFQVRARATRFYVEA